MPRAENGPINIVNVAFYFGPWSYHTKIFPQRCAISGPSSVSRNIQTGRVSASAFQRPKKSSSKADPTTTLFIDRTGAFSAFFCVATTRTIPFAEARHGARESRLSVSSTTIRAPPAHLASLTSLTCPIYPCILLAPIRSCALSHAIGDSSCYAIVSSLFKNDYSEGWNQWLRPHVRFMAACAKSPSTRNASV